MSAKCKYCGVQIFDENGQYFGEELSDGTWVCSFFECKEDEENKDANDRSDYEY